MEKETVQLYIRDLVGSITRPVKELKGFRRYRPEKQESRTVTFSITPNDLKFYNGDLKYDWEPGEFSIMIGASSRDVKSANVNWVNRSPAPDHFHALHGGAACFCSSSKHHNAWKLKGAMSLIIPVCPTVQNGITMGWAWLGQ